MTFLTHLEDATIQRLVEGLLPEAEANAAKQHIEDCARCRRRSGEVSALFTALAAPRAMPEPPVDFLAAVMARVDREPGLVVQPIRPRAAAAAIAAGLATAGAGFGLLTASDATILPIADLASAFTALVTKAGVLGALAKAGAPLVAGAALASAVVLVPFVVRASRAVSSTPVRVTARP